MRIEYWRTASDAIKPLVDVTEHLKTTLDAHLRVLVELRVSQINGCGYCVDLHAAHARRQGESAQRLDCLTVWREAGNLFDARERAALAWAEAVTRLGEHGVPDAVYDQARVHFGERKLVDLTLLVATINAWNRIAIAFKRAPAKRAEPQPQPESELQLQPEPV